MFNPAFVHMLFPAHSKYSHSFISTLLPEKKFLPILYGWNPMSSLLWKPVLCRVGFFLLWALQVSLFIVYRGNEIALQLAMAASPISLAKLLSSWIQNASAHLISSTPVWQDTDLQQISLDELRMERLRHFKMPPTYLCLCCFKRISFSWLKVDSCCGHPLVHFSFAIMASSYHAFYWSAWALKFIIY